MRTEWRDPQRFSIGSEWSVPPRPSLFTCTLFTSGSSGLLNLNICRASSDSVLKVLRTARIGEFYSKVRHDIETNISVEERTGAVCLGRMLHTTTLSEPACCDVGGLRWRYVSLSRELCTVGIYCNLLYSVASCQILRQGKVHATPYEVREGTVHPA